MADADSFDLGRFLTAQGPIFDRVLEELKAGQKQSHWMWFIFPQLRGLGHSPTAQFYGLVSREEATAYLAHPLLGPRLEDCTRLVLGAPARSLHDFFGSPDDIKFRSSMTLFAAISPDENNLFRHALDHWCEGKVDERIIALLTR
jgi:uncharacterized protein (DUF1810 family)